MAFRRTPPPSSSEVLDALREFVTAAHGWPARPADEDNLERKAAIHRAVRVLTVGDTSRPPVTLAEAVDALDGFADAYSEGTIGLGDRPQAALALARGRANDIRLRYFVLRNGYAPGCDPKRPWVHY